MIEERCLYLAARSQTNPLDLDPVQSIMNSDWRTEVGLSWVQGLLAPRRSSLFIVRGRS